MRNRVFQRAAKILCSLVFAMLIPSALAAVSFVQASPVSSGTATTSATTFTTSNNTPGNTICDFVLVSPSFANWGPTSVTDNAVGGNSSVYQVVAGSVVAGNAQLSIWCTPSIGGSSPAKLTITAHLPGTAFGVSMATEYAGTATTIANLIGNQKRPHSWWPAAPCTEETSLRRARDR